MDEGFPKASVYLVLQVTYIYIYDVAVEVKFTVVRMFDHLGPADHPAAVDCEIFKEIVLCCRKLYLLIASRDGAKVRVYNEVIDTGCALFFSFSPNLRPATQTVSLPRPICDNSRFRMLFHAT